MDQVFGALGLKFTVAVSIATIFLMTICCILIVGRRRPEQAIRISTGIAVAVLAIWPAPLLAATFLGAVTVDQGVILEPLKDLSSMTSSIMAVNVLGNIALFAVPAAAAKLVFSQKFPLWAATVAALTLSVIIEAGQWATGRTVSIDDVWLNTLGAVIGYSAGHFLCQAIESGRRAQRVTT